MTRENRIFPFFALFLLLIIGCQEEEADLREDPTAGTLEVSFPEPVFSGNRTLDTLFAVDFDDDGQREYVVTSIDRKGTIPTNGRADRLEIYRFDTASRAWKVVLTDTLLWSTIYDLEELTGDRASELVVETFGGGNDLTSSQGLRVYTGHGKNIRVLFERPDGSPVIKRIDESTTPVILIYSEYWPEFVPHVQSTIYVSDLLSLANGTVESVRGKNLPFFRREAEERMANYQQMLAEAAIPDTASDRLDMEGTPLYVASAETIIALNEAQNREELRFFWNQQQDTLRRLLSEEEFDVLSQLYADKIMK
ncbi:MAG: hypothetical protein KDD67_11705 [Ignavibacteriae bacterium]|nr:hypothetical protein [Ignavibacteriota bacterium]MCB9214962.1 hypothetical protein [Ignavibacteria bacterium]